MDRPVDGSGPDQALPASAQDNLELLAEMAEREDANLDPLRSAIERISAAVGTPRYFVGAVAFILLWVAVNLWGKASGWQHVDEPPFFWLQGIVSSNALIFTIAVLIRQDRMAQLAAQRAHLDLQINMLTERKVTKALELLAALHPEPAMQDDSQLGELLEPADAEAIMGVIKKNDAAEPA